MGSKDPKRTEDYEATPDDAALEALAAYLCRIDGGNAEGREQWLEGHPEWRAFFTASDLLERHLRAARPAGKTLRIGRDDVDRANETLVMPARSMAGSRPQLQPAPPQTDRQFGDYELLEEIARGGMGVVHKARQRKLNRIVAVKTIASGRFADDLDVERFYSEAKAAASLRHPNIVGIHEVGEVDGQHFFSMAYIDGKGLDQLVRENSVDPHRAARYVRIVANAMQYAHDQGILHRDLKPSNILLDAHDQPLVTDFGLAKHFEGQSALTMSGTVVGTPSYIPPEQATGANEDVDCRADVYSLGAVLYELLTAKPPFRAATPIETIRQVIDIEPVSPRLLNPDIPADLETITLKCLQKDRSKRYATAQELGEELERFLNGQPILARPITRAERAWRWCRRNPLVASLSALALLLFLIANGAVLYAYATKSTALEETELARRRAEFNYRQARQAVDDLLTQVSENTLLNQAGMQPLRQSLLQKALEYYERFLEQGEDDGAVSEDLAATIFRVGFITEQIGTREQAVAHYERARDMQEQLLRESPQDPARLEALGNTHTALGRVWQLMGREDQSRRAFEMAVRLRRRLVDLDREQIEANRMLANAIMNVGLHERAQARYDEARRWLERAQNYRLAHLSDADEADRLRQDVGKGYYNLAHVELDAGNDDRAIDYLRQATDVFATLRAEGPPDFENDLNLTIAYRVLANTLAVRRHRLAAEGSGESADAAYRKAVDAFQQAIDVAQPLARRNPDDHRFQLGLARITSDLGRFEFEVGHAHEAVPPLERAVALCRPLARDYPTVDVYRNEFLTATYRLIEALDAADLPDQRGQCHADVADFFHQVLEDPVVAQSTAATAIRLECAADAVSRAEWQWSTGDEAGALESYQAAVDVLEPVVERNPQDPQIRQLLAVAFGALGEAAGWLEQFERAREDLERAIEHWEWLARNQEGGNAFAEEAARLREVLASFPSCRD